jgi:hypothetical protein
MELWKTRPQTETEDRAGRVIEPHGRRAGSSRRDRPRVLRVRSDAQAVRSATNMVAMACELEDYGERESDD